MMTHRYGCLTALAFVLQATMAAPHVAAAQENAEVRTAFRSLRYVSTDYSLTRFEDGTDPWQLAAVAIGARGPRGSAILRVNAARRFATNGAQVEADAYPRLSEHVYAYVNLGYSQSSIFPAWRSGAEVFASLPNAYEASLGYRQLRFSGLPVTLFTGAVGKYVGNYWFSLRPYVRSKRTTAGNGIVASRATSASVSLTARRYYEDADHFFGGRVGFGSTPGDQLVADQVERTRSFSASVQGSQHLNSRLLGTASLGYDREQLTVTRLRTGVTGAVGLRLQY